MLFRFAIPLALLGFLSATVRAQQGANQSAEPLPLGIRFAATKANSPPGSCGCFLLMGGAIDTALPLGSSISAAIEFAGNHAGNVPGTARGLSTLSLMAGPRYSMFVAHRQQVFAQALFGAVRGFDADFQSGNARNDTATVFSYHLGAAYEWAATRSLTVRIAQIAFVQTDLPNGTNNRQRNAQFGAGLVFQIPTFTRQR